MSKTNFEFLDALGQIARDKGISVETLLDALANALVAAYKRRPDAAEEAVVTIDPDSGEIRVYGQELDEDGEVILTDTVELDGESVLRKVMSARPNQKVIVLSAMVGAIGV